MHVTDDGLNLASTTVSIPATEKVPTVTCFAYDCMAWRWDTDFNELVDRHPNREWFDLREHQAEGHCGLAGPL